MKMKKATPFSAFEPGPLRDAFEQLAQEAGNHHGGPLLDCTDRERITDLLGRWWCECRGTTPEAVYDAL